jgi:hypothetical protein
MNDFKTLSNAEKLAEIEKCNFWRGEIGLVEEYMLALADDNRAVIAEYESFGDNPRPCALTTQAAGLWDKEDFDMAAETSIFKGQA